MIVSALGTVDLSLDPASSRYNTSVLYMCMYMLITSYSKPFNSITLMQELSDDHCME